VARRDGWVYQREGVGGDGQEGEGQFWDKTTHRRQADNQKVGGRQSRER
jgi:hypothetical protein